MNALVGTTSLIRLIVRRDRIRLAMWIAVLALVPVGIASAFIELYPTAAARQQIANTVGSNPALVAMLGPVFDSSIGALTAWRAGTLGAVLVGLMALLTVLRHTREEEETGRRELVGSTVVGRHAPLTAALAVASGTGLVLGLLTAGGLVGMDLPAGGAVLFGVGYAAVGAVFAGAAGVAAQLTEAAGSGRGIAVTMLGATFLLRVAGDGGAAPWLSWLSPIGWFTQLQPFAANRWWILAMYGGLAGSLAAVAYLLSARRDVGAGVITSPLGPAVAARNLSSPLGLAARLQRGAFLGWSAGLATVGLVYGSMGNSIGDLLATNPQLREIFNLMGGEQGITDAFFTAAMGIVAIVASAYAVRSALRLRVEEESLRAESVLATATPRLRWAASHLFYAMVGPVAMLGLAGLVAGVTFGVTVGDVGGQAGRVLAAALVQAPAVWVVAGAAVALFGLLPRLTATSWGVLVGCLLLGQLGQILQFPQWSLNLSPFTHVPNVLTAEISLAPLAWLVGVAILLTAAGLIGFQRRDIG